MIKIVVDKNIPFIHGILERYAEVKYLSGAAITNADIKDADVLLVRTRTICGKELLDGSSVKFIGTATIGSDHIDLDYCKEHGIEVKIASGCNAGGVVNYILKSMQTLGVNPQDHTVGIIGVGSVGSLLNSRLAQYGFTTLLNDPPKEDGGVEGMYVSLDELLRSSDIISVHTPLNRSGEYKTENMVSESFFEKCMNPIVFMNSSRGEVVDESSLIRAIKRGKVSASVIDVWQNESVINSELLNLSTISTPHIAGYSKQGKANGASIIINALAEFLDIEVLKNWYPVEVDSRICCDSWRSLEQELADSFNIQAESSDLKNNPQNFEDFRNNYNYRQEII